MKIGYDAKRAFHNSSGLGNYSRDLLRIMFAYRAEYDYYLFNPKPPKREFFTFNSSPQIHQIEPSSQFHKIIHPIWRSKAVIGECKKLGIDIYHGLSNELPLGMKKSGIKSVVSIHDLIFMRFPKLYRKTDRIIYKAKFEQACRDADRVIAISQQTASDIRSFLKIDSKKIDVVYQGCQTEFQVRYSENELKDTRESYDLPERFLLAVGTLERRKNQEIALKALAKLDDNISLVLVGKPTSYKNLLLKMIDHLGLKKRVHFMSDLPSVDLAKFFQLAEVVLYPSLFEGFGIPIVEALASEVPIITSKDSCFKEAGGDAALYIDPNDYKSLLGPLESLLEDQAERNQRIELGRSHFKRFSEDQIAKNLSEVYAK